MIFDETSMYKLFMHLETIITNNDSLTRMHLFFQNENEAQ